MIKELEISLENLGLTISTRENLFLEMLGSETNFFETFEDQVPEHLKEAFQKIRDYVTSSDIPQEFDEIYEISD